MGVSCDMDDLRWPLLYCTGAVSQLDRRRFIPIGYLFVIVCLFGFAALIIVNAFVGGGLVGPQTLLVE